MTAEQHAKVWRKAEIAFHDLPADRHTGMLEREADTLIWLALECIATAYEEAARQEGEKANS